MFCYCLSFHQCLIYFKSEFWRSRYILKFGNDKWVSLSQGDQFCNLTLMSTIYSTLHWWVQFTQLNIDEYNLLNFHWWVQFTQLNIDEYNLLNFTLMSTIYSTFIDEYNLLNLTLMSTIYSTLHWWVQFTFGLMILSFCHLLVAS